MTDKQVVAIMATILCASVDHEGTPAYTPDGAVKKAQYIYTQAHK